jgi:hypothetical protein
MVLLNIIQPSGNSRKREVLKDHLTAKPPSGPVKLSVAEEPGDSDIFVQPDESFSYRYDDDALTAAPVLGNSSPPTLLPSYFDDVIVGRITCNDTAANGTSYSSFLDCYNDSYVGALFNNGTTNGSAIAEGGEPLTDVILKGMTSLILGLIILITVIGECVRWQ